MKDYYYILGLTPKATKQEIKKAYRKLSLKFHPDTNGGDTFFEERFKEIQEAYAILSDDGKRATYDWRRSSGNKSSYTNSNTKKQEEEIRRKAQEQKRKEEELRKKEADLKRKQAEFYKQKQNAQEKKKAEPIKIEINLHNPFRKVSQLFPAFFLFLGKWGKTIMILILALGLYWFFGNTDSFTNLSTKNTKNYSLNNPQNRKVKLFKFNPNNISYYDAMRLGFSGELYSTLDGYIKSGKRFKKKKDLYFLYGMEYNFYKELEPYIDLSK